MQEERPLIGWKAPAKHLGVTVKTAKIYIKRWHEDIGTPIPRTPTGKVIIYPSQLKQLQIGINPYKSITT